MLEVCLKKEGALTIIGLFDMVDEAPSVPRRSLTKKVKNLHLKTYFNTYLRIKLILILKEDIIAMLYKLLQ